MVLAIHGILLIMFSVFYAVSIITFFALFTLYLSWELKKPVSLKNHWTWLLVMGLTTFFSVVVSYYLNSRLGNFIQHMIGGGVVVGMGFFYVKRQLGLRANWRLELLVLLGLVSLLGNINEIVESFADYMDWGIFSFDRYDTWRDIIANTAGAIVCFGVVKVASRLFRQNKL